MDTQSCHALCTIGCEIGGQLAAIITLLLFPGSVVFAAWAAARARRERKRADYWQERSLPPPDHAQGASRDELE
jgi:hypothetical protein